MLLRNPLCFLGMFLETYAQLGVRTFRCQSVCLTMPNSAYTESFRVWRCDESFQLGAGATPTPITIMYTAPHSAFRIDLL